MYLLPMDLFGYDQIRQVEDVGGKRCTSADFVANGLADVLLFLNQTHIYIYIYMHL